MELTFTPGINRDDTSLDAQGQWRDSTNIRFWRGRPQVVGGWEKLIEDRTKGVCRNVFHWTDNGNVLNIALGTHSALMVIQGGDMADITPSGLQPGLIDGTGGTGYGTGSYSVGAYSDPNNLEVYPRTWSLAAWGENLIASPRGGGIYEWATALNTPAVVVSNAPTQNTAVLVAPQRQVLAFGTNEAVGGVFNPLAVRGSDLENNTIWAPTLSNNAFEKILPGGGAIISARVVQDSIVIFTTAGLHLMQFNGAPNEPWAFSRIQGGAGLIGPNAAFVKGSSVYWMGVDGQFWVYELFGSAQFLNCPLRDDVNDNRTPAQDDKIVASGTSEFGEVRWDYADQRDGVENSRYVVLNTVEGTWYGGQMARSAYSDAAPAPFPIGITPLPDGNVMTVVSDKGTFTQSYEEPTNLSSGGWVNGYVQSVSVGSTTYDLTDGWPSTWSFARTSGGYVQTLAGMLSWYSGNLARVSDRGALIENAATNFLLRSQDFTNATWIKSSGSVGADPAAVTAPDGTTTGQRVFNTAGGLLSIRQNVPFSIGTSVIASVFCKKDTANNFRLALFNSALSQSISIVNFDWSGTNLNSAVSSGTPTVMIEPLADGWFRVSITGTTVDGSGATLLIYPTRTGAISAATFYWGAQIELGSSVPSSYIPTAASSATRDADLASITFAESSVYYHERGYSADGGPIAAYLESADIPLGPERVKRVRGLWLDFEEQVGGVDMSLNFRLKPQAQDMQKGPYACAPNQEKIDFMATGRFIRLRLESNSSPSRWRFGRPVIDLVDNGSR